MTALARERRLSLPARLRARAAVAFARFLAANHDRILLWIPVFFGAGIGIYFALDREPAPWIGGAVAAAAALAVAFLRRRGAALAFALPLLTVAAGFATAQLRTAVVAGPVLERETRAVEITGRVLHVSPDERGVRLLLDALAIGRLATARTPERIRMTVRSGGDGIRAGDRVVLRGVVRPPPSPSMPGAFDFARKAWFERIGGVGYAFGAPRVVARGTDDGWGVRIARLRQDLTARISDGASGRTGPVAAAVMTGERRAIPEPLMAAMRDSGLAHLLAISGLHIGLVAGLLFFALRLGLALIEPVALRYPIKKIAAAAAIAGAFTYLVISGATIPTQRAFVTVAVVLGAVIIDRTAISMRMVAVAAMVVLALTPESLLSVSFQMSFAAVVGLVAVYESSAPAFRRWRVGGGLPRLAVLFVATTLLTTLVATLATAPFAVHHFNRLALFGLAANLVAVPLMAAWIMPWAIVSFALAPLGLETLGLVPMGWGIEIVLTVAETVAALPGAVARLPAMPVWGLVAIVGGGLWVCLWRGAARHLGVAAIIVGSASTLAVRPPDIVVGERGGLVAVRMSAGAFAFSPGRSHRYERDLWLRRFAVSDAVSWAELRPEDDGLRCDARGCILRTSGSIVAIVRDVAAAREDCARADVAVLTVRVPRYRCRGAAVAVDRYRLWRDGPHAVWIEGGRFRVETVRDRRGDRPWSGHPRGKRGRKGRPGG